MFLRPSTLVLAPSFWKLPHNRNRSAQQDHTVLPLWLFVLLSSFLTVFFCLVCLHIENLWKAYFLIIIIFKFNDFGRLRLVKILHRLPLLHEHQRPDCFCFRSRQFPLRTTLTNHHSTSFQWLLLGSFLNFGSFTFSTLRPIRQPTNSNLSCLKWRTSDVTLPYNSQHHRHPSLAFS